ncbi:hypothetical protein DFP93_10211 [Aneurinibacillus soli]|uniref:Uncharacterized protein n=3 Tax=Aneurinibacillus soli TaxID=1500254 RepID=A0A0U5BHV3_9BACL|nr:CBO0543 family protein [Aneurinibacillus soli]PYE63327.1 hypothetical protein DFP93_10211 [Aneurinibacillus soli]BAU27742.1 hypothetical protein CB4_01916 [Aneurinibacillus soli]
MLHYVPAMIFSSWLGTYLDLILVEKQLYSFPIRPLPHIFSINIAFTLVLLPIATACFLCFAEKITKAQRMALALLLGFVMPISEQVAEKVGLFHHSSEWSHLYSFFGYIVFMWVVYKFHHLYSCKSRIKKH